MRKFSIEDGARFDDYLSYLQGFLKSADPENPEDCKNARILAVEANNILCAWRNRLNDHSFYLSFNAVFERDLLDVFKGVLLPQWKIPGEESSENDRQAFETLAKYLENYSQERHIILAEIWRHHNFQNEAENEAFIYALIEPLFLAWQENTCGPNLYQFLTRKLNYACLQAFKQQIIQIKQPEHIDVLNKLKASIMEQWSTDSLNKNVFSFLNEILLKIVEFYDNNVTDIEACNQDAVNFLLYFWTLENRENQNDHRSLLQEYLLSGPIDNPQVNACLDEEATMLIQILIADRKNELYLKPFLHTILEDFLRHPKDLEESTFSDFKNIYQQALKGDRNLLALSRVYIVKEVCDRWRSFCSNSNMNEALAIPENIKEILLKKDIFALNQCIYKLRNWAIPKLRIAIKGKLSALSIRNSDMEDKQAKALQAEINAITDSLDKRSIDPTMLADLPDVKLLPSSFQAKLTERKKEVCELVEKVRNFPLEFRIQNLKVHSKIYHEIHELRKRIFPPYSLNAMMPPPFDANAENYVTWIRERNYNQGLRALADIKIAMESLPVLEKMLVDWRGGVAQALSQELDQHFEENLALNWEILPKEIKNYFEDCLKPEGSALGELFQIMTRQNQPLLQQKLTESFAPFLANLLMAEELDATLKEGLMECAANYRLEKYKESWDKPDEFHRLFQERIQKRWDEKDFPENSFIAKNLGQKFSALLAASLRQGKPGNDIVKRLRMQAVEELLKAWISTEALKANLLSELELEGQQNALKVWIPKEAVKVDLSSELELEGQQIALHYFKQAEKAEEFRKFFIEGFSSQLHIMIFNYCSKENFMISLEVLFRTHFSANNNQDPLVRKALRGIAINTLRKAYQAGEAPQSEWWNTRDLPFVREFIIFIRNHFEHYFERLNVLPVGSHFKHFSELEEANKTLAELKKLCHVEKIEKLSLGLFSDLSFASSLKLLQSFQSLRALDLTGMHFSYQEVLELYKAAGSPETLCYQNAERIDDFNCADFEGLVTLDLSGSKIQVISGDLESLKCVNLESCEKLTYLNGQFSTVENLNLSACTSLFYSEILNISEQTGIDAILATRMPQLNIDKLLHVYPVLQAFRVQLEDLYPEEFEALFFNLYPNFSSFERPRSLDETTQIQQIYAFVSTKLLELPELLQPKSSLVVPAEIDLSKNSEKVKNQSSAVSQKNINFELGTSNPYLEILKAGKYSDYPVFQFFLSFPILPPELESIILTHIEEKSFKENFMLLFIAEKLVEWTRFPFLREPERQEKIARLALNSVIYSVGNENNYRVRALNLFAQLVPEGKRAEVLLKAYQEVQKADNAEDAKIIKSGIALLLLGSELKCSRAGFLARAFFVEGIRPQGMCEILVSQEDLDADGAQKLCEDIPFIYYANPKDFQILLTRFPSVKFHLLASLNKLAENMRSYVFKSLSKILNEIQDLEFFKKLCEYFHQEGSSECRSLVIDCLALNSQPCEEQKKFIGSVLASARNPEESKAALKALSFFKNPSREIIVVNRECLSSSDAHVRQIALKNLREWGEDPFEYIPYIAKNVYEEGSVLEYLEKHITTIKNNPVGYLRILTQMWDSIGSFLAGSQVEIFRIMVREFLEIASHYVSMRHANLEYLKGPNRILYDWCGAVAQHLDRLHFSSPSCHTFIFVLVSELKSPKRYRTWLEGYRNHLSHLDPRLKEAIEKLLYPGRYNQLLAAIVPFMSKEEPAFDYQSCLKYLEGEDLSDIFNDINRAVEKRDGKMSVKILIAKLQELIHEEEGLYKQIIFRILGNLSLEFIIEILPDLEENNISPLLWAMCNNERHTLESLIEFLHSLDISPETLSSYFQAFYRTPDITRHMKEKILCILVSLPNFKNPWPWQEDPLPEEWVSALPYFLKAQMKGLLPLLEMLKTKNPLASKLALNQNAEEKSPRQDFASVENRPFFQRPKASSRTSHESEQDSEEMHDLEMALGL